MTSRDDERKNPISKLEAAQRQLHAAIRLFFAGEDKLAIHTVASAAYQIIADLKKERGRDEVADYYWTQLFYVIQDYRRGALPKQFTDNPEVMKWIQEKAEQYPITASMKYEDLRVSVSKKTARDWWNMKNKVPNFLKHADRDPKAHIYPEKVDNLSLLVNALASYTDLVKDDLGAEGLVLRMYFNVVTSTTGQVSEKYREMASELKKLNYNEQKKYCSMIIDKMNQTDNLRKRSNFTVPLSHTSEH
jgi:hypothetical protein